MSGRAPDEILRQSALMLAERGMRVIPLVPRGTTPAYNLVNWKRDQLPDPGWVWECWQIAPFNIGVRTGRPSSLLVLELRPPERGRGLHGRDVLNTLAEAAADTVPARTLSVSAPDGGQHLYFRTSEDLATTRDHFGPRINTHGLGSYVVAPGSILPTGRYYITDPSTPAPLPDWISRQLAPTASTPHATTPARGGRVVIPTQADWRSGGPASAPTR